MCPKSSQLFCVNTKDGKTAWKQDIDGKQGFDRRISSDGVDAQRRADCL